MPERQQNIFRSILLGFNIEEDGLNPNASDYLSNILRIRQSNFRRMQAMRRSFAGLGILLIVISGAFALLKYAFSDVWRHSLLYSVGLPALLYATIFIATAFLVNVGQAKQDMEDVLSEMDLRNIGLEEREKRAQKLFQLHQRELKRYYDQSLAQGLWIFLVGIICLTLGFIVIGITLYEIFINSSASVTDKIIIGVVGAISGILTNFIAAIYMKMFGDTVKSATEFHNRLVATHHLHFGNFLISKIDDNKLRDEALAEVSRAIAKEGIPYTKQNGTGSKKVGKNKQSEEKE
jgi:hypothetical protein